MRPDGRRIPQERPGNRRNFPLCGARCVQLGRLVERGMVHALWCSMCYAWLQFVPVAAASTDACNPPAPAPSPTPPPLDTHCPHGSLSARASKHRPSHVFIFPVRLVCSVLGIVTAGGRGRVCKWCGLGGRGQCPPIAMGLPTVNVLRIIHAGSLVETPTARATGHCMPSRLMLRS